MKAQSQHKIEFVKPLLNRRLYLLFADGLISTIDLTGFITEHPMLHLLLNNARFQNAALGEWGFDVTWDNGGDLTLPATLLRQIAEQQTGNPKQVFNQWMQRNNLSLTSAAESLGMTRRMIAHYRTGSKPIPKTVLLACRGWEIERIS